MSISSDAHTHPDQRKQIRADTAGRPWSPSQGGGTGSNPVGAASLDRVRTAPGTRKRGWTRRPSCTSTVTISSRSTDLRVAVSPWAKAASGPLSRDAHRGAHLGAVASNSPTRAAVHGRAESRGLLEALEWTGLRSAPRAGPPVQATHPASRCLEWESSRRSCWRRPGW